MASLLHDDDGARDVLLLHALAVRLDRLDADLEVLGEEDEHLVPDSALLQSKQTCKSPSHCRLTLIFRCCTRKTRQQS